MPKYYGKIGYVETVETTPGVWEEQIHEHEYFGDLIRNSRKLQNGDRVVSDFTISNQISIIADPYAYDHFSSMRYATVMGAKWTITDVEVQYPRLILSLGGIYNAE